jgi:hypothetical protein
VSRFTQGEYVGVVRGGEFADHAPLVGLRNATPDVESHGFKIRICCLSFPLDCVGAGGVNWAFSVLAVRDGACEEGSNGGRGLIKGVQPCGGGCHYKREAEEG